MQFNGGPILCSSGSREPDWPHRLWALLQVVLVTFLSSAFSLLLFRFLARDPTSEASSLFLFMAFDAFLALVIMAVFLKTEGESFATLGWDWRIWMPEVKVAIAILPGLYAATFVVGSLFQLFLPRYVSPVNPLLELVKTPFDLFLFLVTSIYVGGLKEEIQRAFVLLRFERYLGGVYVGLVVWSLVFSLGHLMQGVDSAVGAGVLGLLFGLLYIRRRKLIAPIVAHALYNIITLVAYWFIVRRG